MVYIFNIKREALGTISILYMHYLYFRHFNDCDRDKELNFIVNQEKKVIDILKILLKKGSLNSSIYEKLRPTGSKLGVPLWAL